MRSTLYQGKYYATPAGICEAARDGDAKGLELILAERPELLVVDCPHNWSKTVAKHEVRGAHFKKPIEVAAFFNRSSAVSTLLAFSRDSMAFRKPWDDHLPFEGHFNSLRIAIALNHRNITELIEKEIDTRLYLNPGLLNQSDSHGRSTTHWAAEQGYMPLVNRLIERGADWDEPQQSGRRVIHSVLDHKLTEAHRDVARELIERGADCDLWIAVALQDVDRVKELLEQDRSLANQNFRMDLVGLTNGFPLVRACASGNRELVELLLECGADINAELRSCDEKSVNEEPAEFGMPLHAAVYGRHYELANFLLDRGASVLAHPNCASPLVDVLCVATNPESDGMLALGELRYLTDDPTSHLQRTEAGSPEVQKLYERVLAAGAEPQSYSYIIAKDYAAIEQRLREESESSFFNAIAGAACWHGDPRAMELCLTLKPEWYSPEQANKNLAAAIRSHNRNGNHEDYYRVLQLNLDYLKTQDAPTTIQPRALMVPLLLIAIA